jgi:hypothetical protein
MAIKLFKKGHKPWNTGTKGEVKPNSGSFKPGVTPWNKGRKYGTKTKAPDYTQVHNWLKYKFGKADRCENTSCSLEFTQYQWAKLEGKPYERVREYFIMLCTSCNQRYDRKSKGFKLTL